MESFAEYLDIAKERSALKSDSRLATAMGMTSGALSQMRNGKTFPSDATMVKVAILAGIEPHEALLDLAMWRTSGPARDAWRRVAAVLRRSAAMLLIALGVTATYPQISANDAHAHGSTKDRAVYIM